MYNADSIVFNGRNTDDFGLVICYFDEPSCDTGLARETIKGNRNIKREKVNYYGAKYSGGIELKFAVAKEDASAFDDRENAVINEWLTEKDIPTKLHVNNNSPVYVNYYGVVVNIEDKIINGRCAKEVTFETDSPYAYEPSTKKKISVENSKEFKLSNNGCNDYYYPKITIIPTDTEIVIENITDKNSVTLNLANHVTGIIIDTAKNRFTDIDGKLIPSFSLGFNDNYSSVITATSTTTDDIYWFRLLKGINSILVTGSCEITFECEFPRKVGSC